MMPPPATRPRDREEAQRPLTLLFVSTWDLLLATALVLLAFAVFGGHREVRGRTVDIPVAVQVLQALAYAAAAAALVVIGILMTRRARWVRRVQIVVLSMFIALIAVGLAVNLVTDESLRSPGPVVASAFFALVDLVALFAMTAPRVVAWFDEPGATPLYIGALIAFWAAATTAFFVLGLVS